MTNLSSAVSAPLPLFRTRLSRRWRKGLFGERGSRPIRLALVICGLGWCRRANGRLFRLGIRLRHRISCWVPYPPAFGVPNAAHARRRSRLPVLTERSLVPLYGVRFAWARQAIGYPDFTLAALRRAWVAPTCDLLLSLAAWAEFRFSSPRIPQSLACRARPH